MRRALRGLYKHYMLPACVAGSSLERELPFSSTTCMKYTKMSRCSGCHLSRVVLEFELNGSERVLVTTLGPRTRQVMSSGRRCFFPFSDSS